MNSAMPERKIAHKMIRLAFLALILFINTASADADVWQAAGSVSATQNNGIITLRSTSHEFGAYHIDRNTIPHTQKKFRLRFKYQTFSGANESGAFALGWRWHGAGGKLLADKGSLRPLPRSDNTFRELQVLVDIPAGATRLNLGFVPHAEPGRKTVLASIVLTDLVLDVVVPSPESLALLAKPLTKSNAEKIWPKSGLRGLNMATIGTTAANWQDPGEYTSEAAYKKMADWNVNLLRLWVNIDEGSPWDQKPGAVVPRIPATDPMAPYKRHIDAIRIALHLAEKHRIWVIITVGEVVGRRPGPIYGKEFAGPGYDRELIKVWKHIAQEFGKHPNLIGYDILNEPNTQDELRRWQSTILPSVVKEILPIDANTYIVVEPAPYGLAAGLKDFRPLAHPKTVYSFHHYAPHAYTHQKIGEYKSPEYVNKPYPGMLKRFPADPVILWDKKTLEKSMEEALAFAKTHNAIMFVGEFSALRWAPGADQWIKDSIDIFEKHGWSWAYHGFRGWNGWNPTFDANDLESNDPDGGKITPVLKVLTDSWRNNFGR